MVLLLSATGVHGDCRCYLGVLCVHVVAVGTVIHPVVFSSRLNAFMLNFGVVVVVAMCVAMGTGATGGYDM